MAAECISGPGQMDLTAAAEDGVAAFSCALVDANKVRHALEACELTFVVVVIYAMRKADGGDDFPGDKATTRPVR